jgi:beta-glucosidase
MIDATPAVLVAWYGGREMGHAIGYVFVWRSPPVRQTADHVAARSEGCGGLQDVSGNQSAHCLQGGHFSGISGLRREQYAAALPFGYGPSYTSFEYSGLTVIPANLAPGQSARVRLTVRNTGNRPGTEIVQLYVHDGHSKATRPPRELKAFQRVSLEPGESKAVEFTLNQDAFSFYSSQ